jgi:hypothetical protein
MKIVSFKSFVPINFGMSETKVIQQLGKPNEIDTTRSNRLGYNYNEFVVRFDATSKLVHEGTLFKEHEKDGEIQINDLLLNFEVVLTRI